MWLKLLLLTLYLALLFLLSRILETVAYYDSGYLASRILDPVSLSVRKLKTLLDQRGMSYTGLVEKKELTELVETSGEVIIEIYSSLASVASIYHPFLSILSFIFGDPQGFNVQCNY